MGKLSYQVESPKTQSVEAVKTLLSWMGRGVESLPDHIQLDSAQLTLSSKGDVYYVTTATACSCPAAVYHPGTPCKHMKSLLAGNSREASRAQARAYQERQRMLRAKAKADQVEPVDSIRPAGKWPGGFNGPVDLLPSEKKAMGVA